MTNNEMEKVKKVELEILKMFIHVCEILDLKWYAGYGTVLGAIRHKGFIPWDDDIDVLMPRRDYEIFCQKAQEIVPDNFFVQTLYSETEYYQPFAKLRRSDTTFWEKGTVNDNINHGIYIDIFPLDVYPTNVFKEKVFMIKRIIYDNFLYQNGDIKQLHGYRKIFAIAYKILKGHLSKKEAAIKKEKLVKESSFEKGKLLSCMVEDAPKAEAVTMDIYGEGKIIPFEDINICIPEKYEIYLKKLYGDYMQFPPEEKRVPLHTCIVVDAEKSYLQYKNLDY